MQRSSTGAATWTSTAATGTAGSTRTGNAPQLLSNSLTRMSSSGGNSNANINTSNSTSHAQPSSSPSGAPSSPVLLANNNVNLNTSSNLSSGLALAAPSMSTSARLVPSASTSSGRSALSNNASELQSVTDSNTARVAPQKNGVVQLAHRQGQQQQVSSNKDNNSKSASAMNFYGIPGNQDASSSMKKQYLPPSSSQQTSEYLSQSHSQSKAGSSSTSSATNALTALSGDSDAVPGPSSAGRETAGTAGGGKESTSAKSKSGNGSSKRKKTETTSNNDYDNRKQKKSESKSKPNSADASAGNVSDAPPAPPPSIVLFPARRQSAAPAPSSTSMARDNSNTSVASTRSLPARMTRGSKRKYVEETTESSDEDDEDRQASLTEGEHTPLKVGPASLALSQSSRKDKGKERAISVAATNEDGLSTAPPSRSTSPEGDNSRPRRRLSASEAQGLAASGTASGLSVRLRKTTSQQSANTSTSTKGRKRKKNRITGSTDPSAQSSSTSKEGTALTMKTRKGSRESQEPPSTRREKTPLQVDQFKDEAASTSDSSVSTPLASASQSGVTADGVEAKMEPVSESEDGRLIGSGKRRGSSAIPMQENRRRNKTKQEASSRPTSAEAEDQNDVKDDLSQSRNLTTAPSSRAASTSTEPTEDQQLLNLPYSDTRSVSAMDGGDEMSVADGSTAMPSPAAQEPDEQSAMNAAAELPENNDDAASTTSTAPVVAPKKRRGRPPKKRPLSQTPAPGRSFFCLFFQRIWVLSC